MRRAVPCCARFSYSKEREARIAAENRLAEERQRFAEHRDKDRRQFEERLDEERRRAEEIHQALLAAIVALTDKIAALPGPGRQNRQP